MNWRGIRRLLGRLGRRNRTTETPGPGARQVSYAPRRDGTADPGEIVWAWVPFEDDPGRGKDRPLLIVGRDGRDLLGLMLSSNPNRQGQRHWLALGVGPWDAQQRPSWVRLDRVFVVGKRRIRREAATLERRRFDLVAAELRRSYGWR